MTVNTKDDVLALAQAKQYIDSIDFSMVIDKMVCFDNWLLQDAEKTCALYRNFLYLNRKYPAADLPPSEDIDQFWHNHILDTEKYIQDCQTIFGDYLHHYPYFGIDAVSTIEDLNNAFDDIQALHFKEFGNYIYATRAARPKFLNALLCKMQKIKYKPKNITLKVVESQ